MEHFDNRVQVCHFATHFMLELGPLFAPPFTTVTKRRLYTRRFLARPVSFFFLSALATLGVWFLTLPARAKLPCTLPMVLAVIGIWLTCYSGALEPNSLE